MPRNQRIAISPPKFLTAATQSVQVPKQNIMMGKTKNLIVLEHEINTPAKGKVTWACHTLSF